MKRHELKTDPAAFAAVLAGTKTHEIRFNDREFAVGDELLLLETVRAEEDRAFGQAHEFTGRDLLRSVTHIQEGYGLKPGWVILSLEMPATITLSGNQLRAALDFINPDGPADELQCNDYLYFGVRQHRADDGTVATDMCCWNEDSDGVLPLPDEYVAPDASHSRAAQDVLAERCRQVKREGYTPEHDDEHACGEIAAYAAFYAMPPACREWPAEDTGYGATLAAAIVPHGWPIPEDGDRRRELVKAGALVLAEIERIDRTGEGA